MYLESRSFYLFRFPDAVLQCIFTAVRRNVPEMHGYMNIHCKAAGYW